MICVSIGRGRHRHVIAEHKYLADHGIRLVELPVEVLPRQHEGGGPAMGAVV